MDRVIVPRLFVEESGHDGLGAIICTIPPEFDGRDLAWSMPDPHWWFMWWLRHKQTREPICPAVDMNEAAHVIATRLHEGTR
jgi:hypothetical protein